MTSKDNNKRENEFGLFEDVIKLDLGNGIVLDLLRVTAGAFTMADPIESTARVFTMNEHQVTLQEFWIGKYAVTNAQWRAVMQKQGSANEDTKFQGNLQPVVGVLWHEARAFCKKLSGKTGREVRLPTEAEWEYAARGGKQSKGYEYAGSNNLDEVAWYGENCGSVTHPVGQKKPNELGICDMSGNVWELCLDDWHDYYANKPENLKQHGNQAWGDLNVYDDENRSRLLRGGAWGHSAWNCRTAYRYGGGTLYRSKCRGFRVILTSFS